nr:MAG TPA: hypothetical protein [Caudoviricetes sp.]
MKYILTYNDLCANFYAQIYGNTILYNCQYLYIAIIFNFSQNEHSH